MTLATNAGNALALISEGHRLHQSGRLLEAAEKYNEVLRREPANAGALHLLGAVRYQQGDNAAAIELMERAITTQPNQAEMYVNLGAAYRKDGQRTKAVSAYERALAINPDLVEASFNLGHALREMNNLAEAVPAYEKYLSACPQDVEARLVLADTLKAMERYDDAVREYENALTYAPNNTDALRSIAAILQAHGWFHAARVVLQKAAALAPGDADVAKAVAVSNLRLGLFKDGWDGMEARFVSQTERILRRVSPPAYWEGQDLSGKGLLVWTEQGLGDEILYAGMIPELIERGAKCIIECSKRLEPIFVRSFPNATIVGYAVAEQAVTAANGIDYQIPAGSLGRYLRPDFNSFTRKTPYLAADPERVRSLRAGYEARAQGRRIVGISWRSANQHFGADKSIVLSDLTPVLTQPDTFFVSLQYGDSEAEVNVMRQHPGLDMFIDPSIDALADMEGFFAQVAAMDLVITTSSTTAHTAGSMNVPVWILLPCSTESMWYWFLRRDDSPWYPSARLFRAEPLKRPWGRDVASRAAKMLAQWRATQQD